MLCLQFFFSVFCLLITVCRGYDRNTELQNLSGKLQQLEVAIGKEIQETEKLMGLITDDQVQKRSVQSKNMLITSNNL